MQPNRKTAAERVLAIPDLRSMVSLYVDTEDALNCMLVNKEWSNDFTYPVWHTIDFYTHTDFDALDPDVIQRNGHNIRRIKNLKEMTHLNALECAKINRLSSLSMWISEDRYLQSQLYQFLRENNTHTVQVSLMREVDPNRYSKPVDLVPVDALLPIVENRSTGPSRLTYIMVYGLNMTFQSLSILLRNCPELQTLHLWGTRFLDDGQPYEEYTHPGVTCLFASLRDLINLDPAIDKNHPIFDLFPNVETFMMRELSKPSTEHSLRFIKDAIANSWPRLTAVEFTSTPDFVIVECLDNIFENLTRITLEYAEVGPITMGAIMRHRELLTSLRSYLPATDYYESPYFDEIYDPLAGMTWIMQMIPSQCPKLEVFNFPLHTMRFVEMQWSLWVCKDLRELKVRIHGLDTAEKIDSTLWIWKQVQKLRLRGALVPRSHDNAIVPWGHDWLLESQVARFLLEFTKLRTVWLGTNIITLE